MIMIHGILAVMRTLALTWPLVAALAVGAALGFAADRAWDALWSFIAVRAVVAQYDPNGDGAHVHLTVRYAKRRNCPGRAEISGVVVAEATPGGVVAFRATPRSRNEPLLPLDADERVFTFYLRQELPPRSYQVQSNVWCYPEEGDDTRIPVMVAMPTTTLVVADPAVYSWP